MSWHHRYTKGTVICRSHHTLKESSHVNSHSRHHSKTIIISTIYPIIRRPESPPWPHYSNGQGPWVPSSETVTTLTHVLPTKQPEVIRTSPRPSQSPTGSPTHLGTQGPVTYTVLVTVTITVPLETEGSSDVITTVIDVTRPSRSGTPVYTVYTHPRSTSSSYNPPG